MIDTPCFFVPLATRAGFNKAVKHIQNTIDIQEVCTQDKINIADYLNEKISTSEADARSAGAVLPVLLSNKWNYAVASRNFSKPTTNGNSIFEEVKKWKAVDLVIVYHHPDLGLMLINPKNPAFVQTLGEIRKNELVVIYAGVPCGKCDDKISSLAVEKFSDLLEGKKVNVPDTFLKGPWTFHIPPAQIAAEKAEKAAKAAKKVAAKAAKVSKTETSVARRPSASSSSDTWKLVAEAEAQAKAAAFSSAGVSSSGSSSSPVAASPVGRKMTPLYSVPVTNELFHNGNVEAWKRIINSYKAKYPSLEVFVYYDGERIIDINTLFKWGKVKHGSVIQFAVAGDGVKDVAKLQRYFNQGASPQFEAFLRGSPNTVMNLF